MSDSQISQTNSTPEVDRYPISKPGETFPPMNPHQVKKCLKAASKLVSASLDYYGNDGPGVRRDLFEKALDMVAVVKHDMEIWSGKS